MDWQAVEDAWQALASIKLVGKRQVRMVVEHILEASLVLDARHDSNSSDGFAGCRVYIFTLKMSAIVGRRYPREVLNLAATLCSSFCPEQEPMLPSSTSGMRHIPSQV
jgi:hypothetical protein